jgi:hypothetical protein
MRSLFIILLLSSNAISQSYDNENLIPMRTESTLAMQSADFQNEFNSAVKNGNCSELL